MIDLRSDTFPLPTKEMLSYMMSVPVGDDGRAKGNKGEDPTAAAAEAYAAEIFGKEDGYELLSKNLRFDKELPGE